MTRTEMRKDMEALADFLEDIGWDTQVLMESVSIPALTASLTLDEDYDELLVFNYIPMGKEDAEFTKLLQIYGRIPLELQRLPLEDVHILMNRMNLLITFGHFVLMPEEKKEETHMGLRCVLGIPVEELPDEGVIGEAVLHITHYCQIMESLLLGLLTGESTLAETLASIESRL